MPIDIVCPSGLAGKVRGFKAREAAMLADKKALREGATFDTILTACWLEVTNPGPYGWLKPPEEGGPLAAVGAPPPKIDWLKVLTCDRFWTLLQIRAATYGDNYEFTLHCQNYDCKQKIEWELKLSDLPFKSLPKSSLEQLAISNEFSTTLPDGKVCQFRLQTGAGEQSAAKLLRMGGSGQALIQVLASRIVGVDGLEKKKKPSDPDPLVEYLGDMEMVDLIALVDTLDDADGGVDTTIEVECQSCMTIQKVELPLGQEFFLPRKRKDSTSQSAPGSSNP